MEPGGSARKIRLVKKDTLVVVGLEKYDCFGGCLIGRVYHDRHGQAHRVQDLSIYLEKDAIVDEPLNRNLPHEGQYIRKSKNSDDRV